MNKLYVGNTTQVIRDAIPDESVDLIFADPPFASSGNSWMYPDTIHHWHSVDLAGKVTSPLSVFHGILGDSLLMKHLEHVAELVLEFHRVLKRKGSIYFNCDVDAVPYVRVLFDCVFGHTNMRNELVWRCRRLLPQIEARNWTLTTSRILYYSASHDTALEQLHRPLTGEQRKRYDRIEPKTGRRYSLDSLLASSSGDRPRNEYEFMGFFRKWRFSEERMRQLSVEGLIEQTSPSSVPRMKRYLDEARGPVIGDIWDDLPLLSSHSQAESDFPSTLPPELASRIIQASTKIGDTVLDSFCGSGTMISEAQAAKRKWIGIDENPLALPFVSYRLASRFAPQEPPTFETSPGPTTESEAQELAQSAPHLFEAWVLGILNARPHWRMGDRDIDGVIDGVIDVFDDPSSSRPAQFLVQAKAGTTSPQDVERLLQRSNKMGWAAVILVSMERISAQSQERANQSGNYNSPLGTIHPRFQWITVRQLLDGKRLDLPNAPRFAERIATQHKADIKNAQERLW